jgi:hypothetical protein
VTCDEARERLDDHVSGELAADPAERLAQHLAVCESCRTEERELRALLARAASLAREVTPERDLWPEIRDRIERRSLSAFFEVRSWATWRTAAAAVLILATTAVVSYRLGRSSVVLPPAPQAGDPQAILTTGIEAEFADTRVKLRSWLEHNRGSLPPDALERIEDSLRVIDDSIVQIRAALYKDPTSPDLERLLLAAYRRDVHLLQRANTWSARM